MSLTGGKLNKLNGDAGISAPERSVPVMKLIRQHNPKSKNELVELIKNHCKYRCECGIVSQGTVEDFGKNLYDAQMQFWKKYEFTLEECIQWEYNLFVINSLRGNTIEIKAISELNKILENIDIEEANQFYDEEFRIDLVIKKNNEEICGIQVKPATYDLMRQGVINRNLSSNEKWGKPVFYLKYNNSNQFTNLKEVIKNIREI